MKSIQNSPHLKARWPYNNHETTMKHEISDYISERKKSREESFKGRTWKSTSTPRDMSGSAEAEEYCALRILQQTRDIFQGKRNAYPCIPIEQV